MAKLRCDECGRDDFRTERGLNLHVAAKHPPQRDGPVTAATERAIASAAHLDDEMAGTCEVLRVLARTIDGMPDRDPDAPMDNVTIPTYLKYAEALGLTALSRAKLDLPEGRRGSRLDQLRGQTRLRPIQGGKGA
ncbi:MAG: terminase small subunit [Armatimonadota bacterium]